MRIGITLHTPIDKRVGETEVDTKEFVERVLSWETYTSLNCFCCYLPLCVCRVGASLQVFLSLGRPEK